MPLHLTARISVAGIAHSGLRCSTGVLKPRANSSGRRLRIDIRAKCYDIHTIRVVDSVTSVASTALVVIVVTW